MFARDGNPPGNGYALDIRNVSKRYAESTLALDDVSLQVKPGDFFALLGKNGAGKSTLINILAGTVTKTAGRVYVWGFDLDVNVRRVKAHLGVVAQEFDLDPFFDTQSILHFQAGLYGAPRTKKDIAKLLKLVQLTDKAKTKMRQLSGGMKRRLMIAKAMVHNPPILILDEPTAGVDIELRYQLWETMTNLNQQGCTIILTTHYIEEAQALCKDIVILRKGKLVLNKKKDALFSLWSKRRLIVKTQNTEPSEKIQAIGGQLLDRFTIAFPFNHEKETIGGILEKLKHHNIPFSDVKTEEIDLEEIFLHYVQS